MGKNSNFLSLILFQLFIQARFQELIRRDPSLLQKKSIVKMDPNQKSKSVTYLVVHTIFFIITNRIRYDIDNKKTSVSVIC